MAAFWGGYAVEFKLVTVDQFAAHKNSHEQLRCEALSIGPLGWEHINLTGDYLWRSSARIGEGKFRPLRQLQPLQPTSRTTFSVF